MSGSSPRDSREDAAATLKRSGDSRDEWVLEFTGVWRQENSPPSRKVLDEIADTFPSKGSKLVMDFSALKGWDSVLPMTVIQILDAVEQDSVVVHQTETPKGLSDLVGLARGVPEHFDTDAGPAPGRVASIGTAVLRMLATLQSALNFTGEVTLSVGRWVTGRSSMRWRDFFVLLEECGIRALPIVGLISFLTGLILAFVGAAQLRLFGAHIYVADLVALAMAREMGALMAGVIMSGRSGAAFAAHIGTMKVSEEIDALTTFGFNPIDMLVLPRMLALFLMMPLLCLYADFIGILGGFFIGIALLDITFAQYLTETREALTLTEIWVGVAKSTVFGLLVAGSGCYHGMRCGKDAAAVGEATTQSVVASIVLIVIADAFFAFLFEVIGI